MVKLDIKMINIVFIFNLRIADFSVLITGKDAILIISRKDPQFVKFNLAI
jgi:hypothetical protein